MNMRLLLAATVLACLALGPVAGHAQSKGRAANLDTFIQQWDPDHDGICRAHTYIARTLHAP